MLPSICINKGKRSKYLKSLEIFEEGSLRTSLVWIPAHTCLYSLESIPTIVCMQGTSIIKSSRLLRHNQHKSSTVHLSYIQNTDQAKKDEWTFVVLHWWQVTNSKRMHVCEFLHILYYSLYLDPFHVYDTLFPDSNKGL